MENRNPGSKPEFVGVSRWRSFKDGEALWLKAEFQKMVDAANAFGNVNPVTFTPVNK